jgi:nitroreductase
MSKILEVIKERITKRKYQKKKISPRTIKKILEAGIWSSSLHSFQPWKFIVIEKKNMINKIANVLLSKRLIGGLESIKQITARTIENSSFIVVVYNESTFANISRKLFKIPLHFLSIAQKSEIQTIAAAIQNMILVAAEQNVACCWNTMPLFAEEEINKLLKTDEEMIAILTFGFSNEIGRRARRLTDEKIVYIK